MQKFIEERLSEDSANDIYQTITKKKLKTFLPRQNFKLWRLKIRLYQSKLKVIFLGDWQWPRHVDLKEVFLITPGLANLTGGLRKTNKAALLHKLEKDVDPVELSDVDSATTVIDGMAMVQKVKTASLTYLQFSKQLLLTSLSLGKKSNVLMLCSTNTKKDR